MRTRARGYATDMVPAGQTNQARTQDRHDEHDEEDICVICQEEMDVSAAIVTLECGHRFHGACVVKHLYTSLLCPICRHDPTYTNILDSDTDEDDVPDTYVSYTAAMRWAKEDKRNNAATARMFKTVRKHKNAMKDKRRELQQLYSKMAPHDDALNARVDAYTAKATNAHNRRYKKTLDAITETIRMIAKSRTMLAASKMRIASKYGYRRR